MADRYARNPHRGGARDYSDRDRHGRDNRDRDRDHDRNRGRGGGRGGRDDRDRDSRRYRSRSRDRHGRDHDRNRRRSRSPVRDRDGHDRRDDWARDGGRGDRRGGSKDSRRDRGDVDKDGMSKPDRDRNIRRSASPLREPEPHVKSPRSPIQAAAHDDHRLSIRSKSENVPAAMTPAPAPVSFKVKGHDQRRPDSTHVEEQHQASRERTEEHEEEHVSRGRFDADPMDEDEEEDVIVEDDGLGDMASMMGFGGFGTTKNQKVKGNNVGAVRKEKKTEYRQYMNRVGGFNRPLSPSR
ncbi:hypothetical protein QR685DRAFT_533816 [Neurospora intermedia]|uniref:U4/U6.U5 small nuclear ribonucleoprotein 27kDa protein domain-containing protein n=1 Tax=Neurospora intermedia TaxID=5142 RepID=A0ABR3D3G5_NEUIN